MSRPIVIACSLAIAALLITPAVLLAADPAKRLDDAFKRADKDHDGTLSRDEAKALPQVSKHFSSIDADKDGTVSKDEIKAYMKHAAKSMQEKGKEAFQAADKNHDGTLSREEANAMPKVARHFEQMDTDKDGTVSEAEIRAYLKSHRGTMKGTPRQQ